MIEEFVSTVGNIVIYGKIIHLYDCDKYTRVINSINEICVSCGNGYSVVNGICVLNEGCVTKNENNGECVKCKEKYTVIDNICKLNDGCLTKNNEGVCVVCKEGYKFDVTSTYCEKEKVDSSVVQENISDDAKKDQSSSSSNAFSLMICSFIALIVMML